MILSSLGLVPEMSTSDPSASEVSVAEFMQMKEQMAEMMRMMQQLVVGGNWESFGATPKGSAPHFENENWPPLDSN